MEKEFKYPAKVDLLKMVATNEFRPFTDNDWASFAGCESQDPLICEKEDYAIVIDGDTVNMVYYEDEYGGELYVF